LEDVQVDFWYKNIHLMSIDFRMLLSKWIFHLICNLHVPFQAEEAQRLRKRRKAETLRILDMERRQKQRVEEMRETQKKVWFHIFITCI
jgi:hypothetical protein